MAADFADEEFVKVDENDYDIIIIGAGLSGLTCAYHILRKQIGLDVLVIEANSEVGGRILQKSFNNTYHANSLQKHVTDLVTKLNIKIDQMSNAETRQKILYTNNAALRILPKFYGAEVYDFFQTIEENALKLKFCDCAGHEEAKYLAETSVEQLLREIVYFSYARSLCRAYICSTCAMRNLNDISALWFLVMLNGASGLVNRLKIMIGDSNRYFIQDGMSKITQTLLKYILQQDGEIRYVEPVNKVTLNNDRAYVSTGRNYFRCEFVVVAVPPSVQSTIIIEPSLSPTNIETLYAPAENVFFNLVYKKPSSSSNSVKDIVTIWDSSNNLNIIYDATHGNTKELVLAGFLAEPNLTQTHKKGLFTTLYDCYETFEPSAILRYKEYDQSLMSDEINPGCPMSVLKPVSIMNFTNHTEASYERIFFASSEYAANWPGTIDGAIQVGENTAYEILWRIRPQALSFPEMSNIDSARIRIKSRTPQPLSLKVCVLQYLGIFLHVAVLVSFLKIAYD